MKFKQHCLLSAVTSLLVFSSEQAGKCFSINLPFPASLPCIPFNSYHCSSHDFSFPGADGGTVLTELKPVSILPLGGTNELLNLLNTSIWQENGWSFQKAVQGKELQGIFDIKVYNAYATLQSVGANIQLAYSPLGSDPIGNNLHWIQRVVSNHAGVSTRSGFQLLPYGTLENKIDVLQEQTNPSFTDPQNPQKPVFNPYYDTYSPVANQVSFEDFPGRPNIFDNHDWYAELYLVEEIAPKTVKIYNGISWGWESTFTPTPTKKFTDSLSAGEVDAFNLKDLTPNLNFFAWIDNDLPQNRCNPNTYLSDREYYGDDDSSFLGDGFASALTGKVPESGSLDLFVSAMNNRGEDSGSYDLYVKVYAEGEKPPKDLVTVGGSGGGGVIRPRPGRTQNDPIVTDSTNGDWQIFQNVPSCRWYDPHTPYGFEFQSLRDTLFTEILDFPVGAGDPFTVWVNNQILGDFRAGDRVDFVSLLGGGISQFKITGIESIIGSTPETAFPIQLAFNRSVGSFQMRPFEKERSVPESRSWIGGLVASMLVFWAWKRK